MDASGAGATFSSGFIYGYLNNWSLEESVRFAIAAASLKVTHSGLEMSPVHELKGLARTIRIERMVYRGDQFHTIRKLLKLPPTNPITNNVLVKEGQKLAQKILPRKKVERKKIKKSMVE